MSLLTKLFHFVVMMSSKHNIDSSHGITHSMNVLHFTQGIYDLEVKKNVNLIDHERIIYVSAILHDMCDKKYMKEDEGIQEIDSFLQETILPWEIDAVKSIISTMSYSKVKVNGFPDLGVYQDAYHVVREADLLAAYDFDRCMQYRLEKSMLTIEDTYKDACDLFEKRMLRHESDGLFLTQYSKENYKVLHDTSIQQISRWRRFIHNPRLKVM